MALDVTGFLTSAEVASRLTCLSPGNPCGVWGEASDGEAGWKFPGLCDIMRSIVILWYVNCDVLMMRVMHRAGMKYIH